MKRIRSFLAILLSIVMLFGMNTAAFAAEAEFVPTGLRLADTDDGVKTIVNFTNDSSYVAEGTVDFESTEKNPIIERIDSFEISYGDEVILTVEPKDIAATGSTDALPNGYYAVSFPIPDSTKECFIAGLTPQNAAKTQEELLAHYASGGWFSVEDLEFIDTEKLASKDDGDDGLCWAAAASNILQYSGWGKRAGFDSEDDIFEAFIDAFKDEGGASSVGVRWFINGLDEGNQSLKKPESGGYLPEYDAFELVKSHYFSVDSDPDGTKINGMKEMLEYLKDGYAVELDVAWLDVYTGHCVTAWGCVTDNAYDDDMMAHYESIIISDSDNNEPLGTDRRVAPNTLDLYHLSEKEHEYGSSLFMDFAGDDGLLNGYTTLKPYSDDIPYETDERATLDHRHDPDFRVDMISVKSIDSQVIPFSLKGYEASAYLYANITNYGQSHVEETLPVRLIVKNAEGSVVLEKQVDYLPDQDNGGMSVSFGNLDQLKSGVYTAEVTVNPDGTVKESLLMNNLFISEFEVVGDKPDVSEVSFSAEIGELTGGRVPVTMDYHDLEQTDIYRQSDRVALITSFFDGDQWSTDDFDGISDLKEVFSLYAPRSKVRFQVVFFQGDLAVLTDPVDYDLPFPVVQFVPDETDGFDRYIYLESGACDLGDEEEISFRLINRSVESIPQISGTLKIYAVEEATGNEMLLKETKNVVLQNGVLSDSFTFSSWDEPLYGTNALQARFVDDDHDNYTIYQPIAMLNAMEKESSVVTTDEDIVDPYDGLTSLREAAAFCEENGGTVTFSDEIGSVRLYAPIQVDKDQYIDGMNTDEEGRERCVWVGGSDTSLFDVSGGTLTLQNMILYSAETAENGGAIICKNGTLVTDHVLFDSCRAENGGGVYFDGGTGRLKNTSFSTCKAARGAAVYTDNDAQVDMLNCTVSSSYNSYDGAVYNNSGKLNMISCAVIGCGVVDPELDVINAVYSNGETNIVNSILTDTFEPYHSASGNVRIYCSAVETVGEGVVTDALTKSYAPKQLIVPEMYYDFPSVIRDDDHAVCYPELTPEADNGCLTSVEDGKLIIIKGGETVQTGIDTPFTKEELHTDILGIERIPYVYGPCVKLTDKRLDLLGDADLSGEVDIIDVTTIQRYDVQMITLPEAALRLADVDEDGEVCIVDATWIQRYLVSMPSPLDDKKPDNDELYAL